MKTFHRCARISLPAIAFGLTLSLARDAGAEISRPGSPCEGEAEITAALPELSDAAFIGDLDRAKHLIAINPSTTNQRDKRLRTPLMYALAPYIGDPPSRNGAGPIPASERARTARKMRIAMLLLAHGAGATCQDEHGMTALHLAASIAGPEGQLIPVAKELLRRGAPVDAATDTRATPLLLALASKRERISRLLIDAGADVHAQNSAGENAEDLARRNKMHGIVTLIESKSALKQ